MFVKRDPVSKKSLITACFVFLVDFPVLQKFDFMLHEDHLLLHVKNVLFF